MSVAARWEKQGDIGIITVDSPPVNALSAPVRQGIFDGVKALDADPEVKAIVLICDGRTFIAGADITEFGKPPKGPDLRSVQETMENASKPIVAAIHGTALGGGLETALAAHYRVAVPSAKVGLPEVKLGLLPGAGGTQRLPRLIGPERALKVIVDGNPIPAPEAKDLDILDAIIDGDLKQGAIAFAQDLVAKGAPARRVRDIPIDASSLPANFFADFRKGLAKMRGFPAPEKIVQCIEAAVALPFDEGMRIEREGITELMASTESKAMRYMFFAEREVAKIPDVPKDIALRPINTAAVLGAGTMGGGIAMNFANAGIPVTVIEATQEALDRGLGIIEKNYRNTQAKGRLTAEEVDKRLGLITGSLSYDDIAGVDIVIEAIFENMEVKKEVFRKLDAILKPGAILASNTSYLDLNEIADVTKRPEDVIGLHFFSPANVMRLLEIVRGAKTAKDVLATCMALAKTIGKIGVVAGVCHGFIGNRMLSRYSAEANKMLLEGATPHQIDTVLYNFGMPMGPFQMTDLAGLDVGARARSEFPDLFPIDPAFPVFADILVAQGRYGQKTKAGFYKYGDDRKAQPDPDVEAIIAAESEKRGVERRVISDEEIIERCIYAAINEGARELEEGIALRPCDIDIIWINGYGFPSYRGGPMFYADTIGVDKVHAAVEKYRQKYGERGWKYSSLLEKLARAGKGFADWKDVV
ncbi:3-hydroxyacyl-CoA dehydrogenase NAD-binding domain-containing protein [Iodidimonas sp. SYSU 1G8]|uniref:3-hydroxyacyl-CoA dehydrogenase NAD-binding domain-containing protein n=1 Tax=Iodidimonas sp. SYSU 1G8 TaxID=3133967 RepID=UPI0031FEDDBD